VLGNLGRLGEGDPSLDVEFGDAVTLPAVDEDRPGVGLAHRPPPLKHLDEVAA
jgi:hypothetical protein